ncbi:MAG: acyl-CoA dehydrogenase family protein [Promethearchaeota archaeon]
MVDFKLSPDEQELWEKAVQFTREYITPHAIELDKADEFPMELAQRAYEAGLMNLHVPKAAGGPERTLVDETLVSEATGYGDTGAATSIMCNNLAFTPLLIGSTLEQLQKYVQPLVTYDKVKLAAFCLTEREAGSDAAATKTLAEKDGDGWAITGRKCWITNAPVADLFTVFASTDPDKKHKGISVFYVPKDAGVKIGHIENKIGQKASSQSEVVFENVHVPADALVGKEGEGFKIAMMTLDKTRSSVAAIGVGVCQRCTDEAARFANIRKQFGQPIGRFEGISFIIADMGMRAAAARHLTRYAAWLADHGLPNSKDSAFAKTFATDAAMRNATDAIQVFGGYGYAQEYGLGTIFRGAKLLQIYEGTNQIQRVVSGNIILKEARNKDTGFKLNYDGVDAPQI